MHLRLSGIYPNRHDLVSQTLRSQPAASKCRSIGSHLNLSCESLSVNPTFGIAYLACEPISSRFYYNPTQHKLATQYSGYGAVYSMDLKTERLTKLKFSDLPVNVSILGIDFSMKDSSTAIISFINHHPLGARVETVSHTKGSTTLQYLDSFVTTDFARVPNSIASLEDGSFYLTSGPVEFLEFFTPLARGNIIYYNAEEKKARIVAKDINFSNGIAKSLDGSMIYSTSTSGAFHIYRRVNPDTGALKLVEKVQLDYYLDNLSVHPQTGQVYVTGHAHGLEFMAAMGDLTGAKKSVGFVSKISNNTGEDLFYGHKYKQNLVFVGTDALFSTISHTAVDLANQKTIFGSLMGKGIVVCDWLL
ncbi:hypothetical protein BDR26DRAFT_933794 [Obelidium mucronatum]|nr:hypothetical protein BDR26DRAFT_933794 [Obelidium mucronatum]